ncbi:MAG TPA: hypothetical protein DCQ06_11175, partial [Myxococcales bacterium]|nr:hypothetical protein [Myxococcales bacterium]
MPKSHKTKTASKWLASGLVPAERSEELIAASVLLASDIPLGARLDDIAAQKMAVDVEMAVVVAADNAGDIDLLVHLRDKGQHKASAKHAKKLLYRAKQRGASIPEEQTREAVSLSRSPEPLPSLCSSFDRNGGQVVLWGGWSDEDGSWALLGIIHDQRGLESVAWLPRLSRSRLRSVMDDLRERRGGELIEVSESFAVDRFRLALQSAESLQTRIDGDKTRVRRMLEERAEAADEHKEEVNLVDDQTLDACSELLDESLLDGWLTTLDDALDRVESTLKSQIEAQTLSIDSKAVTAAAGAALAETFDADGRNRLAAQMQINALLLSQTERGALAGCAATLADALVDQDNPQRASTFFQAVIERLAPVEDFLEQVSAQSTDSA